MERIAFVLRKRSNIRQYYILSKRIVTSSVSKYENPTYKYIQIPRMYADVRFASTILKPSQSDEEPVNKVDDVHVSSIDEALSKIDFDAKRIGRVFGKDVKSVFEVIKALKTVSSMQCLYLLRCCGSLMKDETPQKRTELVTQIWEKIHELQIPVDASHYNALLKVFIENQHEFSPSQFLIDMESKGTVPNRVTYQRLIERYCEEGDINGATAILQFMKDKAITVNESVFNSLIRGHAKSGNFDGAYNVLEVMKKSHVKPNADTYVALACCFAEAGDIAKVKSILEENAADIYLSNVNFIHIVSHLCISGHSEHIGYFFDKMENVRLNRQDIINMIMDLLGRGLDDSAYKILCTFVGILDMSRTIPIFLRQLVKCMNSVDTIIQYCNNIKSKGFLDEPLPYCVRLALENRNTEYAIELFKEMQKQGIAVRCQNFYPVFITLVAEKNIDEIWKTLKLMYDMGIPADLTTYVDYILPAIPTEDVHDVIKNVKETGQSEVIIASALLFHYCITGNMKNIVNVVKDYEITVNWVNIVKTLASSYNESKNNENDVINVLCCFSEKCESAGGYQPVLDVFDVFFAHILNLNKPFKALIQEACKRNITFSQSCANALCNRIGLSDRDLIQMIRNMQYGMFVPYENRLQPSVHPRDMTMEELQKHVTELKERGQSARAALRHMLSLYCQSKNHEKALEVQKELDQEGFIFTAPAYAQLIGLYVSSNQLEEAKKLKQRLDEEYPDFHLDTLKLMEYVKLLIRGNELQEAMDVLRRSCSATVIAGGNREVLTRSLIRLLDLTANTGNAELTNYIFNTFVTNLNISIPKNMVDSLIKVHLVKDDMENAMEAYKHAIINYSLFPCRHILKKCVTKNDFENLQKVLDLSAAHGAKFDILHELAFTFIEAGRIPQAYKVMQNIGDKINLVHLESLCARFFRQDKICELEQLISITRDLRHINRDKLYQYLLQLCAQHNDYKKALDIWNNLQEESVQPSSKTLQIIADLLERNDQPIPFVIPISDGNFVLDNSNDKRVGDFKENPVAELKHLCNTGSVDDVMLTLQGLKKGHVRQIQVNDMSSIVDLLVTNNRIHELSDMVQVMSYLLEKAHVIFKPLLEKYAENGNVEILKLFYNFLPDFTQKNINFNYYYNKSFIVSGRHDELMSELENFKQTKLFSSSGFQELLQNAPHLEPRARQLVEEWEKNNFDVPKRVLWTYYFIQERYADAEELCKDPTQLSVNIFPMVSSIIKSIRNTKNDSLGAKLVEFVDTHNAPEGIRHRSYSCLLDILVELDKQSDAIDLIKRVQEQGSSLRVLNQASLIKLKNSLEAKNQTVPFQLLSDSSSSDSD